MRLLTEAINAIGAVLLQLAIALLIEELTFAGLTRLILAPRPGNENKQERKTGEKEETPCWH